MRFVDLDAVSKLIRQARAKLQVAFKDIAKGSSSENSTSNSRKQRGVPSLYPSRPRTFHCTTPYFRDPLRPLAGDCHGEIPRHRTHFQAEQALSKPANKCLSSPASCQGSDRERASPGAEETASPAQDPHLRPLCGRDNQTPTRASNSRVEHLGANPRKKTETQTKLGKRLARNRRNPRAFFAAQHKTYRQMIPSHDDSFFRVVFLSFRVPAGRECLRGASFLRIGRGGDVSSTGAPNARCGGEMRRDQRRDSKGVNCLCLQQYSPVSQWCVSGGEEIRPQQKGQCPRGGEQLAWKVNTNRRFLSLSSLLIRADVRSCPRRELGRSYSDK